MRTKWCCLALLSLGCASGPRPVTEPEARVGVFPVSTIPTGWTSTWGPLVLRFQGERVLGAYAHRNGRLVGRIDGDVLRGTWCQDSSPDGHSPTGSFTFFFTRAASGVYQIDGHWTYADAPDAEHDDWDQQPAEVEDAALAARVARSVCP